MANQETTAVSGSCICGGVQYELANGYGNTVICYCNSCRKSTGSLFMANSFIDKSEFKLISGESKLRTYDDASSDSGATVRRTFCANCGSSIYAENDVKFAGGVIVSAGTMGLVDGMEWKPQMELFCKYKGSWLRTQGTQQMKEMTGFYNQHDDEKHENI